MNEQLDVLRHLLWLALRIQPLLKMLIQPFQRLRLDVLDVSELRPASNVLRFACAFKLHDEFIHQSQFVLVLFPEMPFAHVRCLLLPMFGSYAHIRLS